MLIVTHELTKFMKLKKKIRKNGTSCPILFYLWRENNKKPSTASTLEKRRETKSIIKPMQVT